MLEIQVGGKFNLKKKIGSGSFGQIFLAVNAQTNEQVAVKLENTNTKHPQLIYESRVIKLLESIPGFPRVLWWGVESNFNVMVMDLLGPSLEDLFDFCNRRLSLKTVLMLADQMICRVEYLHSKNFVHRDIKPDNFLTGLQRDSNTLYMIDFGLAKRFNEPKDRKHIPYKDNKSLTGTARYASLNSHLGVEQSRRDDLEAIGYVLMYFLRGSLPWQGLPAKGKREKYSKILDCKMNTAIEMLCNGFPHEFVEYLTYCRHLKFEERPDYSYLRSIFKELFCREGYEYDYLYDWTLLNYKCTLSTPSSNFVPQDQSKPKKLSEPELSKVPISNPDPPSVPKTKKKSKCLVF